MVASDEMVHRRDKLHFYLTRLHLVYHRSAPFNRMPSLLPYHPWNSGSEFCLSSSHKKEMGNSFQIVHKHDSRTHNKMADITGKLAFSHL